jgi:hypothetical protein
MWCHLDYFSSISVCFTAVLQESEPNTDFVTEILNKLTELEISNERALIKNWQELCSFIIAVRKTEVVDALLLTCGAERLYMSV